MNSEVIRFIGQSIILFFVPLLIVGLGDLVCERSGVLNMCLEGIMILGAFFGLLVVRQLEGKVSNGLLLFLACIAAMVSGMAITFFHAFAAIHLKADQTISATGVNTFAAAFCMLISKTIFGTDNFHFSNNFRIAKVPILGDIPIIGPLLFQGCYITTFVGFALIVIVWFVLYKTKFGLQLRSVGENPQASDSVGISVYKMRYIGTLVSGALAGLGGLIFIFTTSTNYYANVAGYGYLALSVVSFGQWNPKGIVLGTLFFSIMKTLGSTYSSIPFLVKLGIPSNYFKMLPYVATLIVLALTPNSNNAPADSGNPYDKGKR